jgi:hypothetical protein
MGLATIAIFISGLRTLLSVNKILPDSARHNGTRMVHNLPVAPFFIIHIPHCQLCGASYLYLSAAHGNPHTKPNDNINPNNQSDTHHQFNTHHHKHPV